MKRTSWSEDGLTDIIGIAAGLLVVVAAMAIASMMLPAARRLADWAAAMTLGGG